MTGKVKAIASRRKITRFISQNDEKPGSRALSAANNPFLDSQSSIFASRSGQVMREVLKQICRALVIDRADFSFERCTSMNSEFIDCATQVVNGSVATRICPIPEVYDSNA